MSAQFTPGPWVVGNGGNPHGAEFEVRTADKADLYITGVSWAGCAEEINYLPDINQAEANARLIAAAPELYEALRDAANVLQSHANGVTEHGSSPALLRKQAVMQEQANSAFAALAKARGDQ